MTRRGDPPAIFLFAIGARDRASSRLRIWDHVDWLRAQGMRVDVDSVVPAGVKAMSPALAWRLIACLPRWIAAFLRADAVMLQESLLLWPLMLVRDIGKRRRIVFDFSDPVDRHGSGWKGRFRRKVFDLIVRRADVVMVENRAYIELLHDRAREMAHFYGPVDAARYAEARAMLPIEPAGAPVRIGWTGSPGTFSFIAPLIPVIDEIARDHPIEIVLVGAGPVTLECRHARLTLLDWNEQSEFSIVPSFDLGLFRLEDSEDALWRGAGKLFIYMAAGVPFVANDRGIARDLMAQTGIGFPVADDTLWDATLRHAVADVTHRDRIVMTSLQHADALSYAAYRRTLMASLMPSR